MPQILTVEAVESPTAINRKLREFAFSEDDFHALRTLVKRVTGINLTEAKRELVYARLARRLRALNLKTFREYRRHLKADGAELVQLCNAITTNLTAFFREAHHFQYLRTQVLGPLVANPPHDRRLRIWSAGCSTGEEPYSIAMTVLEAIPDIHRWDIRILATDLDSNVLEQARQGIYTADRLRHIADAPRARFFRQLKGETQAYEVAPELRRLVTVKPLNLINAFPMKGPLDAIFCRNVVIYFDKDTQRMLFTRMSRLQKSGHLLFLGHSETLFRTSEAYTLVGRTIYRRVA
jgi:chemotaxis protein methyltransferase CheR